MKIKIEHSDRNTKEFGYGIYINGFYRVPEEAITALGLRTPYPDTALASECIPFASTETEIKQAEKRVRAKALREFNKLCQ